MSRQSTNKSPRSRTTSSTSKSFTRFEPRPTSPPTSRHRASTAQSPTSTRHAKPLQAEHDDVFERRRVEEEETMSPSSGRSQSLPDAFDELPIELASFTDRFVESLRAKVYNEPPTIEQLSDLFQDFYIRASSNISIHISALISKLHRDVSPSPSKTSQKSRNLSAEKSEESLKSPDKLSGSQQMLTASEVTEKRKARKLLEYKRILLEEAVERRACENVYDKIWRHKSTLDEVRDEKLRSKTAALALVGIGLRDLGIEMDASSGKTVEDIQASLTPAREGLAKMNEEKYPLGKLQHLTTAHKAIVDTLSSMHSASSSADEILPTLIYTLVTSPIEGINIISNLYFIQRFRAANKMDGEAAYCLTNLEAAISFLENVDLSSLREDEVPEGPKRNVSQPATPGVEKPEPFPKLPGTASSTSPATVSSTGSVAYAASADLTPTSGRKASEDALMAIPTPRHQRTLSDLFQPPAKAISNANEAVRSTAEEGFRNVSNTLDNSFKFLFGKLRERGSDGENTEVVVPKTLDEARILVSRPLTPEGDDTGISETSSLAEKELEHSSNLSKTEDKILTMLGGRRVASTSIRERSVDSSKSNGSGKRVVFAATGSSTEINTASQTKPPPPTNSSNNPLESVKNFGNSINPINHLGSAFGGAFRSFGTRPAPGTTPLASPAIVSTHEKQLEKVKDLHISVRDPTPQEVVAIKAQPPIPRFMETDDVSNLKISDVQILLEDYQRIARILEGLSVDNT